MNGPTMIARWANLDPEDGHYQDRNHPMKFGYADPPYIGQSKRHYGDHPDYAGEVDHRDLLQRLDTEFDGWLLHLSAPTLGVILGIADDLGITGYRVMAWVKPFAAFKPNVPVAYAWEPVLVKPVRKPVVTGRMVMRDWLAENITMQRGLSGAKPEMVCRWLFEVSGLDTTDTLVDLFPGSGAVTDAWDKWVSDVDNDVDTSPQADRYSKLPKWAQMEIASLREAAGLAPVEGYVWCDRHGCIHNDTLDPYDDDPLP